MTIALVELYWFAQIKPVGQYCGPYLGISQQILKRLKLQEEEENCKNITNYSNWSEIAPVTGWRLLDHVRKSITMLSLFPSLPLCLCRHALFAHVPS